MNNVKWQSIESQDDLDLLNRSVCWDDSETLEYYGFMFQEDYYPHDISRSGYRNVNLHMFIDVDSILGDYLHWVLIDCDHVDANFLRQPFLDGHVDVLKRVEVFDFQKTLKMRCSRMIYRFVSKFKRDYQSRFLPEWFSLS